AMATKKEPTPYDGIATMKEAEELYVKIGMNKVGSIEDYRGLLKDINAWRRRVNEMLENGDITEQEHADLVEQVGKDMAAVEKKYASQIESLKTDLINDLRGFMKDFKIEDGMTAEEKALVEKALSL